MPVNNTKKVNENTTKESDVIKSTEMNTEIEELKKENEVLKSNLSELMNQVSELLKKKGEEKTVVTSTESDTEDDFLKYKEPDANKQIRLVSMYYGVLTLCNSANRSVAKTLKFGKFGEVKSVLYHDLVDYVNNERKFAEEGYFYILDKAAVYYLGLSSEYKKLVNPDFVKNIMNYSESEIHDIASTMTNAQRDNLIEVLSNRMYAGEMMDMNKIEIINKITGVNIQNKVEEMKKFTDMQQ